MEIQGSTFTLRPWRRDDADALVKHANDPRVSRNLGDRFNHPFTMDDAEQWFSVTETETEKTLFAIEVDGEAVGGCGIVPKDDVHWRTVTIGYWLGVAYWGRGIATEVARLLTEHAFCNPNVERVEAIVYAWNPVSGRVLEKNGFVLEARHRKAIFKDDEFTDMLVYANFRGD
jgi:RimJ/RimL family protein N-acetyltransferase